MQTLNATNETIIEITIDNVVAEVTSFANTDVKIESERTKLTANKRRVNLFMAATWGAKILLKAKDGGIDCRAFSNGSTEKKADIASRYDMTVNKVTELVTVLDAFRKIRDNVWQEYQRLAEKDLRDAEAKEKPVTSETLALESAKLELRIAKAEEKQAKQALNISALKSADGKPTQAAADAHSKATEEIATIDAKLAAAKKAATIASDTTSLESKVTQYANALLKAYELASHVAAKDVVKIAALLKLNGVKFGE